jgi:serine/threonine-protein kinase
MSDIKLTGFELLQQVGQGGMGVVWKARQLSLDRVVAIKLLAPELNKNPDDVKRMLTEARTAARLKHPGIVQVYDASEEGGNFFFVMEYVDGYNVGQWIHRKKSIPWKDALLVAEYVAGALDYASRTSGMIHCDIKPENIMVDQDGTIKVSDLGLSVTHETRSDAPSDILGTPSYMSPEQVRGEGNLDCRTDIYSLGATLYHMITGHRLFHEVSDREAMDRQLTHQVPDPQEVVPGLPATVGSLLERLLVKDREGRPKNWSAVLADLRRVQKGLMPAGKAPPEGASTIKRARMKVRREKENPEGREDGAGPRTAWVWWTLGAAAVVVAAVILMPRWRTSTEAGSNAPDVLSGTITTDEVMLGRDQAMASFASADRWVQTNPDSFDEGIRRYRKVMAQFPGTPEAGRATGRIQQIQVRRTKAMVDAWQELKARVDAMAEARQYREAINLLESYAGPWAAHTASNRTELARSLRQQDGAQQLARVDEENWLSWLKGLATPLALGKFAAAQQAVTQAQSESRFRTHATDLAALAQTMKGIDNIGDRVIQSFTRQVGTVIKVGLGRGEISVQVASVNGKKVRGHTLDGQAEVLIGYDDLSPAERMVRLGPMDAPEVAIVQGAVALGAGAFDRAAKCFENAGPLLSGALLEKLAEVRGGTTDDNATVALARVLKLGGVTVGAYDEAAWLAAVNRCAMDRERAALVSAEVEKFLEKFGRTEFATKATPVVLTLQQRCGTAGEAGAATDVTPAPEAAAPVEPAAPTQAIEGVDSQAVQQSLMARNPGLEPDAIAFKPVEGAPDARVEITSDSVRDLSPIAAVKGITALLLKAAGDGTIPLDLKSLAGSGLTELRLDHYVVKDVAPLKGSRLTRLALPGSSLLSITQLEGLALTELDISGSEVRDLNALRGMRLEWLDISNTKIASLSMLMGMPLKGLNAAGTPIRDVYALKGLPLESLNLARTAVYDLQSLKGLRLTNLDLGGTKAHDLAFAGGMPLKILILRDAPVQDVSVLKGRSLDLLDLGGSQVKDLLGLAGCSIKDLRLDNTPLSQRDLAQLQQVSVEQLDLSGTGATSLGFLEGKSLTGLQIANTKVKDLGPLRGMPLRQLNCQGTDVQEYAALRNMPIEELRISGDLRELRDIAGSLLNLRMVNGFDVRDRIGRPAGRPNARN